MEWITWSLILLIQNFSFTFVSRARNSGSLTRHLVASIFSNGVWFVSQIYIFQRLFDLMTGKEGFWMGAGVAGFYTFFTVLGALTAHYWALRSEKGKGAVGANKKYAQITVAEWERVLAELEFAHVRINNRKI